MAAYKGGKATCRYCGKKIEFIKNANGKFTPVDLPAVYYSPSASGPDTLLSSWGEIETGYILSEDDKNSHPHIGNVPHFVTCAGYEDVKKAAKNNLTLKPETPEHAQLSLF